MQTNFTAEQLRDPDTAAANQVLRSCVHCGLCTATCPTFLLLGDELDSPRGRIYLIKDMLETGRPATEEVVRHVDRCLSCLACMTTCPSGVHYMHLVDHARGYIERTYRRPWRERALRAVLGTVLPRPALFRAALLGGRVARPFAAMLGRRVRAMLALMPAMAAAGRCVGEAQGASGAGRTPRPRGAAGRLRAAGAGARDQRRHDPCADAARRRGRRGAGGRLLRRPDPPYGPACVAPWRSARANIAAWSRETEGEGLDAIVINASGCGTMVKDYGFMFRSEPEPWRGQAGRVSQLACDVSELLDRLDYAPARAASPLRVAYHSACSLQHGQQVTAQPKALLRRAGFTVVEPAEAHICCGSAGTYNMLQPEIATRLRARKLGNLHATGADLVAAGNIGCITQLAGDGLPVVHTVELLDWMAGGPLPPALQGKDA